MIFTKSLSSETWDDFASLMETDSQCKECWCLNHREPSGCPTGFKAKEKMKFLTSLKKVQGLLAYNHQECIGWIAVDPMSELVGHDCQKSSKESEWSIHCLFIKDRFRGRGISTQLIGAAIEYAKANGARVITAFPIPQETRNSFPQDKAEFSGRYSTYIKLGFKPSGEPSEFYQRVELV